MRAIFAQPLSLAFAVREQRQHQRGRKIYSLHAPEVECIGKGKAHRPYEFGVKISLATTLHRSKGGQFIAHVKAMPGNPYDGHTLATVLPEIEAQIGAPLTRIVADRGYRGHNAPPDMRFKIYISGQRRGVTDAIKRELRRRSAVEPVIGHAKAEHRMGRNFLKGAARRRRQRRPRRRRLQLPKAAGLAGDDLARPQRRHPRRDRAVRDHQTRLTPPAVPTVRARSSRTTMSASRRLTSVVNVPTAK